MTRDEVKVNVTRVGVIVALLVGFIAIAAAFVSIGDGRYVSRDEFLELKSDVRVIKCAVRPTSQGCP